MEKGLTGKRPSAAPLRFDLGARMLHNDGGIREYSSLVQLSVLPAMTGRQEFELTGSSMAST